MSSFSIIVYHFLSFSSCLYHFHRFLFHFPNFYFTQFFLGCSSCSSFSYHLLDLCLLSVGCLGFWLLGFFLGFLASWLSGPFDFWLCGLSVAVVVVVAVVVSTTAQNPPPSWAAPRSMQWMWRCCLHIALLIARCEKGTKRKRSNASNDTDSMQQGRKRETKHCVREGRWPPIPWVPQQRFTIGGPRVAARPAWGQHHRGPGTGLMDLPQNQRGPRPYRL